jgi:uncharacterized protein YdeI (YjbR/CyaY-like superfamily)
MDKSRLDDLERIHPETRAAWRRWLKSHHGQVTSVWLVSWKIAAGKPRMTYDEIVEEALCWGWVDSLPRALDAERTMLLLSPRKPGSSWSALNKARAERMIARGQMMPAGLAKIEAAKRDGAWDRLKTVDALKVPADLAQAFSRHKGSSDNFAGFPPSTRRGILEWVGAAKRPETRAKRIEETASLAAVGKRANQWRDT